MVLPRFALDFPRSRKKAFLQAPSAHVVGLKVPNNVRTVIFFDIQHPEAYQVWQFELRLDG